MNAPGVEGKVYYVRFSDGFGWIGKLELEMGELVASVRLDSVQSFLQSIACIPLRNSFFQAGFAVFFLVGSLASGRARSLDPQTDTGATGGTWEKDSIEHSADTVR